MEKTHCRECNFISSAAALLSDNELETLESECAQVTFNRGEILFKQDALSTNIIYLKTGLIKIHISGSDRDQIIKVSKAPSFLGIPTTFADKTNHYSATALVKSVACFIDINAFKNFIYKNGEFAYEVIVSLCRDELDNFHRYVDYRQKQLHGRMADTILYFSNTIFESDEFEFPLTRSEFGDLIYTSRESVSRVLWELNNDNIIDLKGKKIKILNKKLLEQISKNG